MREVEDASYANLNKKIPEQVASNDTFEQKVRQPTEQQDFNSLKQIDFVVREKKILDENVVVDTGKITAESICDSEGKQLDYKEDSENPWTGETQASEPKTLNQLTNQEERGPVRGTNDPTQIK